MKLKYIIATILSTALLTGACSTSKNCSEITLKDAFKGKFLVGVAINKSQCDDVDLKGSSIAKKHFNSVVAENVMKCALIHPEEKHYFFDDADRFVKFGEENNMFVIGHCLIWHSQCAPWFCHNEDGSLVDKTTLCKRMRDHIHTIVSRYKGRVRGWDVVNEAIEDDGSYRQTDFYKILGDELIPLAFQYAHEADPDAELYLNDFSMTKPGKRDKYIALVKELKNKGLRIDAIGMQSHMGLDYPMMDEFEKSIKMFASTGCKVMITEWDMSALPTVHEGSNVADVVSFDQSLNPYVQNLPDNISDLWNSRMDSVMQILLRNHENISRVTVWGISDGDSWKNDFPVPGRKDYPLFFDRDYNIKPFLSKYIIK